MRAASIIAVALVAVLHVPAALADDVVPTPEAPADAADPAFAAVKQLALAIDHDEEAYVTGALAASVRIAKTVGFTDKACRKAFGGKRVAKKHLARLAHCLMTVLPRGLVDGGAAVKQTGKAWEVTAAGLVFGVRGKKDGTMEITSIAAVSNQAKLDRLLSSGALDQLSGTGQGVGVGVGTGTGTTRGIHGGAVQGDFVAGSGTGTGAGTGTGPQTTVSVGTATGTLGGYTAEELGRSVKARLGIFRACYQKELNRTPKLAGTVVIQLEIDDAGAVHTTAIVAKGTTLKNADVESCVERQIQRVKFPVRGAATVAFALTFATSP